MPVETIVKEHQQDYYDAIAVCDQNGESTSFIVFMLQCLKTAMQQYVVGVNVGINVGIKVADKVADKIIQMLQKEPTITTLEIAKKLGMSDSGIRKVMTRLKAQGRIQRIGANKNGYWQVNNPL